MNRKPSMTIKKVQETRRERGVSLAMSMTTVLLFISGFFAALDGVLNFRSLSVSMTVLIIVSLVAALGILLFDFENFIHVVLVSSVMIGLMLIYVLMTISGYLSLSLGTVMNALSEQRFMNTGIYHPPYASGGSPMVLMIGLALFAGAFVGILIRFKNAMTATALGALLMVASLGGYLTLSNGLVLMWAALFLMFSLSVGVSPKAYAAGFAAAILLAFTASLLMTPLENKLILRKEASEESAHKAAYEKHENALPEGHLADLGAFEPTDDDTLAIRMDNWQGTYIRGFVGAVYDGKSWQTLSPEAIADEAEELYVLQRDSLTGLTTAGTFRDSTDYEDSPDAAPSGISLENVGACRAYTYLPEGISGEVRSLLDHYDLTEEGGKESVSYDDLTLYPITESYQALGAVYNGEASLTDAFKTAENHYRDFVYAHYLDIPENVLSALRDAGLTGSNEVTVTQAKKEIRRALDAFMTYDESYVMTNHDEDPIVYLCRVSRRGYSVHYASMAVMMLRSYGIPARYAEGYVVTKAQASRMAPGAVLTLTERNSRAYVEYYQDGIGWLPYDPTPGMDGELIYNLPEGSGYADSTPGNTNLESIEAEEESRDSEASPDVRDEEEEPAVRMRLRADEACLLAVLCLFLCAVLLAVHIVQKRRYFKRRRTFMKEGEIRAALARLAIDTDKLVKAAGGDISEDDLIMRRKIWFSRNVWEETDRKSMLTALEEAEALWLKRTPLHKKLWHQYLLADIYIEKKQSDS